MYTWARANGESVGTESRNEKNRGRKESKEGSATEAARRVSGGERGE